MVGEYSFDVPIINLLTVIGLIIYSFVGIFLVMKLIYIALNSEYKKDPDFNGVATALRWKFLLVMLVSPFLIGIPLLGGILSIGSVLLYIVSPINVIGRFKLYEYLTVILLLIVYYKFYAKKLQSILYRFIKKETEFEFYFRSNAKNWGLSTYGDKIDVNENEYKKLALFAKVILHFGLIPLLIIFLLQTI